MVYIKDYVDAVSYHNDKFNLPYPYLTTSLEGGEIFYGEIFTIIDVTYSVSQDSLSIPILGSKARFDLITEMYVDGGEIQSPASTYMFSEPGEHQIRYVTKRRTLDFSEFLDGCVNVLSVNLDQAKTYYHRVLNMSHMFSGCSQLTSINLTSLNTSAVTDMSGLFEGCSNLSEITMFNPIYKVKDFSNMFSGVNEVGTFYYNPTHDFNEIISILPPGWNAVRIGGIEVGPNLLETGYWDDNLPWDDEAVWMDFPEGYIEA